MSKVYSLENVNELAGGDQEFIVILVQTFLEEIPPDVDKMLDAVQNNNAPEAYQFAHKMKPNLQLFNVDLDVQIKTIESWSNTKVAKEEIIPVVKEVVTTVNQVVAALKRDFR